HMQIGEAVLGGSQALLHLADEVGHVGGGGGGAVGYAVHREYEGHVFLRLLLAGELAAQRGGGGARALGGGGAALIARVHIALVVVADVEDVLAALRRAGQALEAAVGAGAVAGHGDYVHVLAPHALVHVRDAGEEGGGVVKQGDVDGDLHAAVKVPADDAAAGHAAGGHADDGVFTGDLQYAAQHQLAAAALAGGNAGGDHVRAVSEY